MSKRSTPNFFTCLTVYLPHKRVALRASSVYKIVENENLVKRVLYTEEALRAKRLCGK